MDAAVAAAFALAVVEPKSSGLGGGGFALVYLARERRVRVLDFREVAPAKATREMYLQDGKPRQDLANAGALSIAVPGAVRGYAELSRRFGARPLREAIAPAETLASRGFKVGLGHVRTLTERKGCVAQDPEASRLFLRRASDGELTPPAPGESLVQRDLARTLRAIARFGPDVFYAGPIARRIVSAVQSAGGILTLEDLAVYRVREREPVEGSYRGLRIVSMPPPSSGGLILIALLQVLEQDDPRAGGYQPESFLHVMLEAEKRLFARRQEWGDPDFNPGMAEIAREIVSKRFARALRAQIGERATPAPQLVSAADERSRTTHVSVIDEEGNAVALTTTVNDGFGSCLVAPGTGVVLNDQMDDFAVAPGVPNAYGLRGGSQNAPEPGKVPLSAMAPTLVFDPNGALRLSLGAAGGASIPTTLAQTIVRYVDDGMPIDRALAAPRLHHNLFPDEVRAEPDALEAATAQALAARGHRIHFASEPRMDAPGRKLFDEPWGAANAVAIDPATGWRQAASDPRRDGAGAIP